MFSQRQVQQAEVAGKLYEQSGSPGYAKFFKLLDMNYFINSPVTTDDMKRYLVIYGPHTSTIQGKTARKKANKTITVPNVPIPAGILENNRNVKISGDVLYLQQIPIIHTISDPFQLRTVEEVHGKKANKSQLCKGSKQAIDIHQIRGLVVQQFTTDNEFECVRDHI